jgi:hypothetical protein
MKVSTIRKGLLFVSFASMLALGCELIVDFDRTLIPVEGADTGIPDVDAPDAELDAPIDAIGLVDAEPDAEPDAESDAGSDADAD